MDKIKYELLQIIKENNILLNPKSLKGILADIFPEKILERNILTILLSEGILDDRDRFIKNTNVAFYKYVKILSENYGIQKSLAKWAVETWCFILNYPTLEDMFDEKIDRHIECTLPYETFSMCNNDFSYRLNGKIITNVDQLSMEVLYNQNDVVKHIKRKLFSGYFRNCRSDIADIFIDAEEDFDNGKYTVFILNDLYRKLNPKSQVFFYGEKCFNTSDQFLLYCLEDLISNEEQKNAEFAEFVKNKVFSYYCSIQKLKCEKAFIKYEESYTTYDENDKYYKFCRIILSASSQLVEKFWDIARNVLNECNKNLEQSLESYFRYREQECSNKTCFIVWSLCDYEKLMFLSCPTDRITMFESALSKIAENERTSTNAEKTATFKYKYQGRAEKKVFSEKVKVRRFIKVQNANMNFCPQHNKRLTLVRYTMPTSASISSWRTLTLKHCAECKAFVTDSTDLNRPGVVYIDDDRERVKSVNDKVIVCKECGTRFELSENILEDYKKQHLATPIRCEKCENEYREYKNKFL